MTNLQGPPRLYPKVAPLMSITFFFRRLSVSAYIPIVALDHGYDPRGASRRQPREAQNVMNRQLDHPQHLQVVTDYVSDPSTKHA
jgi:hypothetical protein